ncbi:nuclear transport factor 2 family protein [Streptococcus sp. H49]|uniref:nuclear transport factor 2 family protein n=1 Tax=Streptococcus huangxiaojuni TaxID=3237239 RepID=UPI0034A2601D
MTMTAAEELAARSELKLLVDRYANESDKDNQDYYVNIFTPDCQVRVYFNNEVGMEFDNVQDLIAAYKSFGAAKEALHINGQQVVEFQDAEHATGVCYGLAHLVNEEDGADKITTHGIRYYDSYVKQNGKWLIAERDQYFVFSKTENL